MSVTLLPQGGLTGTEQTAVTTDPAPTSTYRVDWPSGTDAVGGQVDGLAAMRQAVFKYLMTQRNHYPIYDGDYGIETDDLVGRERGYVRALLPGRVRDALSVDERIVGADGFAFEDAGRDGLHCAFTVHTIFGDVKGWVQV